MKQKILPKDLKIGMYVSELDRPWLETQFLYQGIKIQGQAQIDELIELCEHVYIDVNLELESTPDDIIEARKAPDIWVRPEVERHSNRRTLETSRITRLFPYKKLTSFREELPEAYVARRSTRTLIKTAYEDTRKGRRIDTQGARKVVGGLLESVIRNPDAMTWLTQLKKEDEYTAEHSLNVCIFALTFGRHLNLEENALQELGLGALLHDIGKMKVPNDILNKPEKLTEQEFAIIQRHPEFGYQALSQDKQLPQSTLDIAHAHHERSNGRGYPRGLKEETISFFTKIVSIVDVYDAITSNRCYHTGTPANQALDMLFKSRTEHFDDELVDEFIKCIGVYPIGSPVEMNTGEIAIITGINPARRLAPIVTLIMDEQKRPYAQPRTVNLSLLGEGANASYRIVKILGPGSHNINMSDYLVHKLPEMVEI